MCKHNAFAHDDLVHAQACLRKAEAKNCALAVLIWSARVRELQNRLAFDEDPSFADHGEAIASNVAD